jgi:hypothetical protein
MRVPASLAAVGALIACSSSSPPLLAPEGDSGWVQADVSGAHELTFEGNGYFVTDPDYRLGLPAKFQFISDGFRDSEGQSVYGVWFDGGIPPVGRYPLVRYRRPMYRGFSMFFSYRDQRDREAYTVTDGEIEIETSTAQRVEGRFVATAWLHCKSPIAGPYTPEHWCVSDPAGSPIPQVQSIDLSGSFSLAPSERRSIPD